jgi:cobalt/nickel transport system ATP-binding protein
MCGGDLAISVRGLHFAYPDGTVALRGVDLDVPAGARMAIIGPNGAGKSTLLLHLNGLHLPQRGSVHVLGRPLDRGSEAWVRRQVGLVFQDPDDQVFAPTVFEDVAFGPSNLGLDAAAVARRAEATLEALGLLKLRHRPPQRLSPGEKRRVAIAGVLAMDPAIIVCDEPVAFLDGRGRAALCLALETAAAAGRTLIVATHDVDFAATWAESVALVSGGRVVARGGRDLLAAADLLRAHGIEPPVVARVFAGFQPSGRAVPLTAAEGRAALAELVGRAPGAADCPAAPEAQESRPRASN